MKKVLYVTTVSRTINAFLVPHIEMLIDNGYKVGSEIYYERQSGTINTLLYGEKLQKILNEND